MTFLCVSWSVPNYFSSAASWYILYLSTFGTLAALRYLDTSRTSWLLLAGFFGGLGLLVKVVALYYIAAVGLFIIYHAQSQPCRRSPSVDRVSLIAITSGIAIAFGSLVFLLLRSNLRGTEVIYFLLPALTLCGLLIWNEYLFAADTIRTRIRTMVMPTLAFGLGIGIPVAVFSAFFWLNGGLHELYEETFILPLRRLEKSLVIPLPPIDCFLAAALLGVLLGLGFFHVHLPKAVTIYIFLVLTAFLIFILLAAGEHASDLRGREVSLWYRLTWQSMHFVLPAVVLCSCWLLAVPSLRSRLTDNRRSELFLIVAMAALLGLNQYPYSVEFYFCYNAPWVILAILNLVVSQHPGPRWFHGVVLAFYLAFALCWLNTTGDIYQFGHLHSIPRMARLNMPRARLWVPEHEAYMYDTLVDVIQACTAADSYIYAAHDCPEVYFLSERQSITRQAYGSYLHANADEANQIMKSIREKKVPLVVLRVTPIHSSPLAAELIAALRLEFPEAMVIGRFLVASRDKATRGPLGSGWQALPAYAK